MNQKADPIPFLVIWNEVMIIGVIAFIAIAIFIYLFYKLKLSGIKDAKEKYDFILIDCPPAIGMLTVNALVASNYVLLPLQAEFLPLKGLRSFMHHFNAIKSKLNKNLEVLGFILTRYDERKTMNRQVYQELENEFGEKAFHTHIRSNIQLAKAQEAGTDIFNFDKQSHGAEDYNKLAEEFLHKLELTLLANS